jgi:hypothetical protein
MIRIAVNIVGTMPMLMSSQNGMNMKDEMAREFSIKSKKRMKSDEDKAYLSELEFRLRLYWDKKKSCVYLPSFNIIRCIQDGGKKIKLGVKVIESLRCDPECINVPVIYPGCDTVKTIDDIAARNEHWDIRTVGISGVAVERTRPRFNEWSLEPTFLLDTENMEISEIQACLDKAGLYKGIGDFRVGTKKGGQFGTFTATVGKAN